MSGNLPGSTTNGQKDTNTVANSHQVVGAKSRAPDKREVGKAKSYPRGALQHETSTANAVRGRSSD